jgi:acyl-[acyl-carrier-protein] desaturase
MALDEQIEMLEAIEPVVGRLIEEHRGRRKPWYHHEFVPWELGRSFVDVPWEESQCTLNEQTRTALLVNLLTEDNLPYYHLALDRHLPEGSAFKEWGALWTAEEGQHAMAIRSFLLASRNCDPVELEDDRMATVQAGWVPRWEDAAELFTYTSAQELATRISHRNAGKISNDPAAFALMRQIATDENHHFVFYKSVMAKMIDVQPSLVLEGMYNALANFQRPGVAIPGFVRRSIRMAQAGVYNLRIHRDRIVVPLLEQWGIEHLTDLAPSAAEFQERLMAIPDELVNKAERFEARFPHRSPV